jgi:hypothetical protein
VNGGRMARAGFVRRGAFFVLIAGGEPETVVWSGGHTLLAVRSVDGGRKRLIMIATGDHS